MEYENVMQGDTLLIEPVHADEYGNVIEPGHRIKLSGPHGHVWLCRTLLKSAQAVMDDDMAGKFGD